VFVSYSDNQNVIKWVSQALNKVFPKEISKRLAKFEAKLSRKLKQLFDFQATNLLV
jgi:hypothetical protein